MPSPNNLPLQLTSFIGREREIADVKRLLATSRLLTLTGPGGSGKTRLALQVASQLLDEYPDGVFFVNLAPITDPDLVISSMAQTFDVKEVAGQMLIETLKTYLADKGILLLLDNFEQVVEAATLVVDLLLAAPNLKVMVTSREPLHIQGEQLSQVPPLELPDPNRHLAAHELSQYEAVALFVQRSQAVKLHFALTEESAAIVGHICTRLDGLPLAIELAAARIGHLTPKALLQHLDNRLKVLIGGARNLSARQQTLRSTIQWSYDLLSQGEQQLFRRMAVFQGGCTLKALEAVCNYDNSLEIDVQEGVYALVDKNLLQLREGSSGESCFWMLETIHEYARESLQKSEEQEEFAKEHALYFMRLAEESELHLSGEKQGEWLDRLEDEHDNIRTAIEWSKATGQDTVELRLIAALSQFWHLRGYISEEWDKAIEVLLRTRADPRSTTRAQILVNTASLAVNRGNATRAYPMAEEAMNIYTPLGDKIGLARSLKILGDIASAKADYDLAHALYEEALEYYNKTGEMKGVTNLFTAMGNLAMDQADFEMAVRYQQEALAIDRARKDLHAVSMDLNNLGDVARCQGDWSRVRLYNEECLELCKELQDLWGVANAQTSIGISACYQGDFQQAINLLKESLTFYASRNIVRYLAMALTGLAGVATRENNPSRAACLLSAIEVLISAGIPLLLPDQLEYERSMAAACTQVDEATWQAAWHRGQAMSMEQAVAYALEEEPQPDMKPTVMRALPSNYTNELTKREVEVLGLVSQGLTNAKIAEHLFLSPATINAHLTSVYSKLGVTGRNAATRFAIEHNLL